MTKNSSAKYWSKILDKLEMRACQLSKRGGYLHLKIKGDSEMDVISNAKIVFESNITIV
jgi:hypothetical protein